jgi:hypothetical protein
MEPKSHHEEKERIITKTATFRIEEDILDELSKESKHQSESLNVLINKLLKSYINWHKPLYESGNIYFSKALIARVFDSITDEYLVILAEEHVKNEFKENLSMLGLQYDLQSFLDVVCSWCEASGFPYRYNETNDADIYTIRFDMGKKWAIFFGKQTQIILDELKIRNAEVKVTNNTVMLKFKDKRETNPKWAASY